MRRAKLLHPGMILALDLSLTGAGMVALAPDWNGRWKRIPRRLVAPSVPPHATEEHKISRLGKIVAEVLGFAREHGCTSAYVEDYAFSRKTSRAHALGELGGCVKLMLRDHLHLVLEPVAVNTARATLLGRGNVPRKDPKAATRAALEAMGMPDHWSLDEGDAFVVGNHAMAGLGGYALMLPARPATRKLRQ